MDFQHENMFGLGSDFNIQQIFDGRSSRLV